MFNILKYLRRKKQAVTRQLDVVYADGTNQPDAKYMQALKRVQRDAVRPDIVMNHLRELDTVTPEEERE